MELASKSVVDDNENKLKIIAVVKANGYGLGILELTKFLIENGIDMFAVSSLEEALKLRQNGIENDILMLSSTSIKEDVKTLVENDIILTIGSNEDLKVAEEVGNELKKNVRAHLKIDTGFGRYGFIYTDKENMIKALKDINNIKIEGTYTHFSNSYFDDKYTKLQFDRFLDCIEVLKLNKIETGMLHVCNTSAFIKFPSMHLNAVRLGSIFTGRISFANNLNLKKIGYLKANVSEIKEVPKNFYIGYSNTYKTKRNTKIAIVPVGYMDGVNLVNGRDMLRKRDKLRYIVRDIKDAFKDKRIFVTINQERCPVLGMCGTYHITVDITGKDVKIGDEVILDTNIKLVNSEIRRNWK